MNRIRTSRWTIPVVANAVAAVLIFWLYHHS
jgi:hypothetical protein